MHSALMFSLLLSVRASPATASAVANSSETTWQEQALAAGWAITLDTLPPAPSAPNAPSAPPARDTFSVDAVTGVCRIWGSNPRQADDRLT